MERIYIGTVRKDFPDDNIRGRQLYIQKHSGGNVIFWSFGKIGNYQRQFELKDYLYNSQIEMIKDCQYYGEDWYRIMDLFKQAYGLQEALIVYKIGGHITTDDEIANYITNESMVNQINNDINRVLEKAWEILSTQKIKNY